MINWGIIGCGNVTETKSGPAFNKVEGSHLMAVMRRNISLAKDYAGRHNVPRYYGNADELIGDPDINAIYVATPPSSHKEYALMSISAGKPVLIEKPMALNFAECIEINNAAADNNVPVFVAYYRRALPGFLKVKDLIDSGAVGNVRHVKIELFKSPSDDEKNGRLPWRVKPEISGGGHFFDLASHQLDYLDFLFGPVVKIKPLALNMAGMYPAEDFVSADFIFGNGIVATGTWCFALHKSSDRDIIEFSGDKGRIKFSTFTFEPIYVENDSGITEYPNEKPEHVHYYLIKQIVGELTGKGKASGTGISAARTSRVMDEVVKEYYKKS